MVLGVNAGQRMARIEKAINLWISLNFEFGNSLTFVGHLLSVLVGQDEKKHKCLTSVPPTEWMNTWRFCSHCATNQSSLSVRSLQLVDLGSRMTCRSLNML
jgi:hypothetical protein